MLTVAKAETIYIETLEDLKAEIEARSSVLAFCKEFGIDRPNLVRTFSALRKKDKNTTMSLANYIKICVGLGLMEAPAELPKAYEQISFLTYLTINHTAITNSILNVKFM